jgi:hypothetical protein
MPLITSTKGSGDVNNLSPAQKLKPLQSGTFTMLKCKQLVISSKIDGQNIHQQDHKLYPLAVFC